jgi:hypothetical protein
MENTVSPPFTGLYDRLGCASGGPRLRQNHNHSRLVPCAVVRLPPTLRFMSSVPTQPGWYWFQPETTSRALMVEVRLTNGELTVWWPNDDQPVANLNEHWRGPIPPSSGAGSR